MTTAIIVALIVASAPTLAVLVNRRADHREREQVARKVQQVAIDAEANATSTSAKLDEIHILVNSRLTQALERIEGLEDALKIGKDDPIPGEASAK